MSEEKKVGEENAGLPTANSAREVKPPSKDAMRFVHNWLWEGGEAEMWRAANLRDAARILDAFSARNPERAAALLALNGWRAVDKESQRKTAEWVSGGPLFKAWHAKLDELRATADSLSPVVAEEAKADE